jgi:4-amino-4-deoxy-L-arabinose transferase-like glycosyltransferase
LAAITVLAAFLRLYRIDSLPPSDGYDQATYGLDVLDILDGARPIFLPTNFGREALFSYLVTLTYLIIGDVAAAVYVTSAVAGVLAIPATYLAAEELFAAGESTKEDALARWGGLVAASRAGT